MKRLKVKRLLAVMVSVAMFASNLGNLGFVHAEEPQTLDQAQKELVWEVVEDEPILADEVALSSDQNEAVQDEEAYAENDQVRVFIVFDGDSVVDAGYSTSDIAENRKAAKLSEKIEQEQEQVISDIESDVLGGSSLDTRYSFTILTNAISADVRYGQIADIEAVDGVAGVYIVPVYEIQDISNPNTITSGDMVGSYNTWKTGYTGAGRKIAVIDTGIDADHPSFAGDAFMYSLEEIAAGQDKTVTDFNLLDANAIAPNIELLNANKMYNNKLTAQDVYLSEKIPYAFNYVDENLEVTHDKDTQGDHGTHVAGISLANRYVPAGNGKFELQENGVVGIAPEAQLLVMKVFGAAGGAYSDDYMAAIEDALVLGADAINLSLGSSNAGESSASEEYINTIFDKLIGSDTIVSISAGNAYAWSEYSYHGANLTTDVGVDTVGSPGSYKNAFTVASAVNSGYTGEALLLNNEVMAFYQEGSSGNNLPITTLDTTGKGTEYDYVIFPSFGTPEDYKDIDVTGKIVFVSRGVISFAEKHTNGAKAGAAAVVVYNNTEGSLGMSLSGSTETIPCVSIYKADALAAMDLSEHDEEHDIYTGKVVISSKVITNPNAADGYTMSDFSSWGVPGDLALKPEITAPGGNIYSTMDKGTYGNMSGTSMAAPSISGLSALVLQYIKENNLDTKTGLNSRALGQALLMSTATPLVQKDGELYSPRKQGAGLANIEAATKSPAYILVGNKEGNDGKVKAEFGDDPERTGRYGFDFTVYNMTDKPIFYKLDSTLLTESVVQGVFTANSSHRLESKIDYSSADEVLLYDVNCDGRVNFFDAKSLLAYVNKSLKSELVDTCLEDYDFNNDGIVNTCDAQMFLSAVYDKHTPGIELGKKVLRVKDKAVVKANINLTENDKKYISGNFENGMYVEGFAKLDGKIDMSIPMLGFFGNWTDSSMFEPYDYMAEAHGEDVWPAYSGVEKTNYLTYQHPGDARKLYYSSNMYVADDEYIADRNAISSESGASIAGFTYTLIRNAATVKTVIENAETGEEYVSIEKDSAIGAFYYASQQKWMNTSATANLNWSGKDKNGNPLPDGTKVNISIKALPAYYNEGTHTPGKGSELTIPMTIDNTNPTGDLADIADGKITVKVKDNQYVAAVYIYDYDKETLISRHAVNQKEKGVETELTFEYPETVFYVCVIDYAGNTSTYRVNMSNMEDTNVVEGITLNETNVKLLQGNTIRLKASLAPVSLVDDKIIWSSEDESVATVDQNGIVKGVSEGTTTITATTNALDKDGNALTASCEVEVFTISAELQAVVWDENGKVNFSKFNTKNLPNYTKLSDNMSDEFWSAAQIGPNKLLASTHADSQEEANYYLVDTTDYSTELIDTSVWSTDLTYGYATDAVFGTYAHYINVIDPKEGVLGQIDLSKYTDGEYLIGIAHVLPSSYNNTPADYFYLLDRSGDVYLFFYVEGVGYSCEKLGSTNINTNGYWYYNSITYDYSTGLIYWAMFDGSNVVTLYAIQDNEDDLSVFELGQFNDGVWPVSGLYMNIFASDADSENSVVALHAEDMSLVKTNPSKTIKTVNASVTGIKEVEEIETEEETTELETEELETEELETEELETEEVETEDVETEESETEELETEETSDDAETEEVETKTTSQDDAKEETTSVDIETEEDLMDEE